MSEQTRKGVDCPGCGTTFMPNPFRKEHEATYLGCPLHQAAPDLLAALEETHDELKRVSGQLSEGRGIDMWGLSGLPMLVGQLQAAIAKATLPT